MLKFSLAFICCFPFFSMAEVLISTDFASKETYQALPEGNPDHITGMLPKGVLEDSGWAKIGINYSHQKNPLGGDLGWLDVDVKGGDEGQAQLKWILPPLNQVAKYRLTLSAASPGKTPVTFAIRDGGSPWGAHWEQTFLFSPFMDTHTVDFTLPALGDGKVLIAHMGREGNFHFQKVRLVQRDPAELAREAAELRKTAPANQLSLSGFPLGLPPLWSTASRNSWERDIRVESADEVSPRGTIPLRLATRQDEATLDLYSAPFEPLIRSDPHTVSFYIKGTVQDGSFAVTVNKKNLASTIIPNSPDKWTRVSLTFTPDEVAPFHVMRWTIKGDVEIDSLMLNLGNQPLPFELKQAAEVTLSADRRKNHVIVDGVDKNIVRVAVTGETEGSVLHLKGFNIHGDRQILPSIELKGNGHEILEVPLDGLFPDTPYGPFRIEASVRKDEQVISPVAEVVLYRLRKPRHWGELAPSSKFGGHFHDHEPHLYSAKAIGQNWNRLHGDNGKWTYWSGVEPEKGTWTFHHERMKAMQDAGFNIIGVWVRVPGWARIKRQIPNGWLDNWWQPRDYDEFVTYAKKSAEAYKPYIQHWQIWNEPWGEFWFKEWRPELGPIHQWHPGPDPEGDYAKLSAMTYQAVKQQDPEITILGINATIGGKGKKWMQEMLKRDGMKYTDIPTFHAYAGGRIPQLLENQTGGLQNRIDQYILDPLRETPGLTSKPELWLTEGNVVGSRSHSGGGLYHHSFVLDPDPAPVLVNESQLLSVYHLVCFSRGTDKLITYAQNAVENHFHEKIDPFWGALGLNGGELNPSAAVYAAMTWHIDDADFRQRLNLNGVHTFVFQRGDTAVAALIAEQARSEPWTPPADQDLTWRDSLGNDSTGPFDFGTIVWVERKGPAGELVKILTSDL